MRLLFVDDESRVLTGIENALLFASHDWEADFANSGEDAVQHLGAGRYDVLVTDMQMPGMTGADVLEWARQHAPHMVRIVLSGEMESDLAQRAMPLAHEFVSKPCPPVTLFTIIERVHSASASMTSAGSGGMLASLDSLPSNPALYQQIQVCIERGDGIDEIAQVVETDVAVSASVLRMANSAFYGFATSAETVRAAAVRLGANAVAGLVLNAELSRWVGPEELDMVTGLNAHATDMSIRLHALVGSEVKQARLTGLLHDIGRLVILSHSPEQYRAIDAAVDDERSAVIYREKEMFGVAHPELGAQVLRLWKADPVVVEATKWHHHPELAEEGPARVLARAIEAISLADRGVEPDELPDGVDVKLVARAGELSATDPA